MPACQYPSRVLVLLQARVGNGEKAAKEHTRGWVLYMWLLFLFLSAALGRLHLYITVKLFISCSA